jgi:RNA-splicing ligase RtcB
LKAQGRQAEIEETIKRIKAEAWQSVIPDDLCWVDGQAFSDYLFDMDVCQTFAVRSRELMASYILEHAGLTAKSSFHTIHNYIDINDRIIRKGAISAKDGELLLIPINMRDGSILGVGRGNPEWNFSAPHGAGRIMSRNAARANISMDDFSQAMQGIYTTTAVPETIDEAPMAYKGLNDILDNIRDTVDVLCILKPIYNFKAAE